MSAQNVAYVTPTGATKRARQKTRRIACAASAVLRETRDPARAAAFLIADQMRRARPGGAAGVAAEALRTEHPATVALAIELSGVAS